MNEDSDFIHSDLHEIGIKEEQQDPDWVYKDHNKSAKESHDPEFVHQDQCKIEIKEEDQDLDFTDQGSSSSSRRKKETKESDFLHNEPDLLRCASAGPPDQQKTLIPEYLAAWTEETEDELIRMIQDRPGLYDTTDKCYVNQDSKTELWREMERKLAIPGKEIRKRWKSLRTQYTRYIKLDSSGRFGQRTERQQWILHRLQFLEPHQRRRECTSSQAIMEPLMTAVDLDSPADSSNSETSSTQMESCSKAEPRLSSPLVETTICAAQPFRKDTSRQFATLKCRAKRSRKKVKESADEVKLMRSISKTLQRLASQDSRNDAISAYCRHLEHRLRQLPPHLLPHFQFEVDTCLYKYSVTSDRRFHS